MTLQFTRNTNFVFNVLYVVYNFAIFASTKYAFHKFHILIFFNLIQVRNIIWHNTFEFLQWNSCNKILLFFIIFLTLKEDHFVF